MSLEQTDKLNELINRKNNLRGIITTYNAQVHGRSPNEMDPYIPLATSTETPINAEDAAIAALSSSAHKHKYPDTNQQVTSPLSTLNTSIAKQYPSIYDTTGPNIQGFKALSHGGRDQTTHIKQQRIPTPIPPGKWIRSNGNRRLRQRQRRSRVSPKRTECNLRSRTFDKEQATSQSGEEGKGSQATGASPGIDETSSAEELHKYDPSSPDFQELTKPRGRRVLPDHRGGPTSAREPTPRGQRTGATETTKIISRYD
jgi:hypothetical protein